MTTRPLVAAKVAATDWPSVEQLAAMPDYRLDLYRRLMGDDFPSVEQLIDAPHSVYKPTGDDEALRWVYFLRAASGEVKIGVARNVQRRLCEIQACSPVSLVVAATVRGGQQLERDYHRRFADHRLHGEWFAPHPDILAEIERLSAFLQQPTRASEGYGHGEHPRADQPEGLGHEGPALD